MRSQGVDLLQAAVAAAHTGGQHQQSGFFHMYSLAFSIDKNLSFIIPMSPSFGNRRCVFPLLVLHWRK